MCEYATYIKLAVRQLSEQSDTFDMLEIRNRTREIAGPTMDVRFQPCKFEALAFFEQGGLPGFVLTTKTIETETDKPVIDKKGHHYVDGSGALVNEFEKRSVFTFIKVAALIHDALRPQWGHDISKN